MAAPKTHGGHKTDKLWRDALMVAVNRAEATGKDKRPFLARLADKCVKKAMAGSMIAMKEIGDRIDGKPVQPLDHKGDVGIRVVDARSTAK